MNDSTLAIAFASNAKYMCLTAAAAWTALQRLSSHVTRVRVLLLADKVSHRSIRAFERSIRSVRPDVQFDLVDQHPPEVSEMARLTRAPEAQFLRLYAARHLASHASRMIYLDSDVLVKQDLLPLVSEALNGNAIGAVPDFNYPTLRRRRRSLSPGVAVMDVWRRLPVETPYLNSGMLLIDTAQWQVRNLESLLVDHILRNPNAVPLIDQDALVQCLTGQWQVLPKQWNVQTIGRFHMPELRYWGDLEVNGIRAHEIESPAIVHYNGSKPLRWGISLRGRTRGTELDVCRALFSCGYETGLGNLKRQVELRGRGVVRPSWIGSRRLARSVAGALSPKDQIAPRLFAPQPALSMLRNEGGMR